MSKVVTFRFPEELLERVDSARGEEPRSKFVLRALEGALTAGPDPSILSQEEAETLIREAANLPPRSIPCEEVKEMVKGPPIEQVKHVPPLRCPSSGCDFRVPSPNARCPKHGRRVR